MKIIIDYEELEHVAFDIINKQLQETQQSQERLIWDNNYKIPSKELGFELETK